MKNNVTVTCNPISSPSPVPPFSHQPSEVPPPREFGPIIGGFSPPHVDVCAYFKPPGCDVGIAL